VHAFVIWYVVLVVQRSIFSAQDRFLELRFKWLKEMPQIRANTVMVEGIPDDFRSDEKLKSYFGTVFDDKNIQSAYVVKDTRALTAIIEKNKAAATHLQEANAKWEAAGKTPETRPTSYMKGDLIELYTNEVETTRKEMEEKKAEIMKDIGGASAYSGFVTFKERKYAQMATTQLYSSDLDEWVVSCPPAPTDLLWNDLQKSDKEATAGNALGTAMIVGLYFAYMPLVIWISQAAAAVDGGPLWDAFAPTLGLQIMVGFLPTILILIFRACFVLKADAWSQKKLQNVYFWFMVIFVVLVTAIGGSVEEFTMTLIGNPLALPDLLGATMPPATHFYMNFLVLQWPTHAQNLVRYVMLFKYLMFSKIMEEEDARKKSEPEDQDYYGIGSRSARFTINMVIGVVFGTLSPPINALCWMNFAICRLVYGYLIPFAEQKKTRPRRRVLG
jgi:hypothetical protein